MNQNKKKKRFHTCWCHKGMPIGEDAPKEKKPKKEKAR